MPHARKSPVSDYRRRIKREGYVRLEVRVRKDDAALVREVVNALADPTQRTKAVERIKAMTARKPLDFKEFLASAPLEEIDLTRDRDMGRDVEF